MSPNFFIIGSVKCGTTWLFDQLAKHPDVFCCTPKEPHYYSRAGHRPRKSYMRHIHNKSEYDKLFSGSNGFKRIGEASTSYLWSEIAAQEIYNDNPEAKIIAILRDPVSRAHSHYLMDIREGVQSLPFHAALLEDDARPNRTWHEANLYVDLGMYYEQLKRLYDTFPQEQVLVLPFEGLRRNQRQTLKRVTDFLEIDELTLPDKVLTQKSNAFAAPRGRLSSAILGSERIRNLVRLGIPYPIRSMVKEKILTRKSAKPNLSKEAASYLIERTYPSIDRLSSLIDFDPELLRTHTCD